MKDKLLIPVPPFFMRKDGRIRVHVFLCVMGMLFYRYLAKKVKYVGLSIKELQHQLEGIFESTVYVKKIAAYYAAMKRYAPVAGFRPGTLEEVKNRILITRDPRYQHGILISSYLRNPVRLQGLIIMTRSSGKRSGRLSRKR